MYGGLRTHGGVRPWPTCRTFRRMKLAQSRPFANTFKPGSLTIAPASTKDSYARWRGLTVPTSPPPLVRRDLRLRSSGRVLDTAQEQKPKKDLKCEQQCLELERITGYHFNFRDYVKAALSSSKVVTLGPGEQAQLPQKHLAIIGDALLKLIYFTENFPSKGPSTASGLNAEQRDG